MGIPHPLTVAKLIKELERDALQDPKPGDELTNGEWSVVVVFVERDQVYFNRWKNTAPDECEAIRVPLALWPELCRKEGARVVQ
jgi:hypothetical protein